MPGPLEGLRVVELGIAIQGPAAGLYFANMGADVIKVEPPFGDASRYHRGVNYQALPEDALCSQFLAMNKTKRSVALDLHTELGQSVMGKLLEGADVFLTNVREEALERMGLGLTDLTARHPRLVVGHVNGFGPRGDEADKAMLDGAAQARGGIVSMSGQPGAAPTPPGSAIADRAYRTEGRPAVELVEEAEQLVYAIGDRRRSAGGPEPIREVLVGVMDRIDELHHLQGHITGVPTGFIDLDRQTAGLQRGDLVVVAGRPSMGKTALALNVVESVALRTQLAAVVFSMEMSARQLADRMLAMVGQVDQAKLRSGRLDDANWKNIESALGLLTKPNLFVYEVSSPTPALIRRMSRRLRANHGNKLDLIVIDYLQLIPGDSRHESNRNAELAVITRELKAIAVELETPVLCLSQLNREGAGRAKDGEAPVLQQLRDSGAIEQDADIVMFLYNVAKDESMSEPDTIETELKVAKNRNGPTFTMKLNFTKKHFHFVEPSLVDYQDETPQDYGYSS